MFSKMVLIVFYIVNVFSPKEKPYSLYIFRIIYFKNSKLKYYIILKSFFIYFLRFLKIDFFYK